MYGITIENIALYQKWSDMVGSAVEEIEKNHDCSVFANVERGFYWVVRNG